MAQVAQKPKSSFDSKKSHNDNFSTRLVIYRDIADITWRMFVPSIAGAVAGVIADRNLGTKPWCTVAGVTLGFVIVIYLVYRQIQNTAPAKTDTANAKKTIDKTGQ